MSFNPPPTMAEDVYSQFLHDFPVSPNPQGNTADTGGLLDDYTNSNPFNNSFQASMTTPVPSSSQSRSLLSLPQPNFNLLSYPIPTTNYQQSFNQNSFFNPNPTPAQNTWTLNQHNVPNNSRALIQPQAFVAESVAENRPGYPTATIPNHFHNPASSSVSVGPAGHSIQPHALVTDSCAENTPQSFTAPSHFHNPGFSGPFMDPGQPGPSGWGASTSSRLVTQHGGGEPSLAEHHDEYTNTHNIDPVVPQATNINATPNNENVKSRTSPVKLPSNPAPTYNRPDLPYVLCCFDECYKIYQGMDAFITHLRSDQTAQDPGHGLTTSSTTSNAPPVQCPWQNCTKSLIPNSLPKHMEQHALIDWICAVPGCTKSSSANRGRALKHFLDDHDDLRGGYPMDEDRVYEIPATHRRNA